MNKNNLKKVNITDHYFLTLVSIIVDIEYCKIQYNNNAVILLSEIQQQMKQGKLASIHINKKQYLETCESENIKLSKQQIKIPLISNIVHLQSLGLKKQKNEKKQRKLIYAESPTPKYSYLVEHLCLKLKNSQSSGKGMLKRDYSEIKSEGGISRSSTLGLKSQNNSYESRNEQNEQNEPKIVSPAQKYRKYLPSLNTKQVTLKPIIQRERPRKKLSLSSQKQKESRLQKSKLKILKQCYDIDLRQLSSTILSNKSKRSKQPSTRRIKTEQQSTNQFLLERILTVKPTLDLRRDLLTKGFEKSRQYLKIKQRKNMSWAFKNVRPVTKNRVGNGTQFIF